MGLLSGLLKAGIATKLIEQARKPQNQAKAKDLFTKVTSKGKGQGGTTRRP